MTTQEILELIGKNIQLIRIKKDISQQVLAAACNFEKSNMSRIENGNTNITIATLNKIATALGVPVRDLLDNC